MWEAIKNWMAESHKKEQEQYGGFTKMLSEMPNAPKAHDNVDKLINDNDRIDPSTIQEERYGTAPFALYNLSKYGAKTKGGERREILRSSTGLGTKDRQRDNYLNLLQEIAMNPDFADTLSRQESKQVDTKMDYEGNPLGFLKYLLTAK